MGKQKPKLSLIRPKSKSDADLREAADKLYAQLNGQQAESVDDPPVERLTETITKLASGKFRLLSGDGKNLGTFDSREAAEKHEREVNYFKHQDNK